MSDEPTLTAAADCPGRKGMNRFIANAGWVAILMSCSALVIDCVVRYAPGHSFWLDEAFVAVNLRSPSLRDVFGPLEYGQYFPRLYLAAIAGVREVLGYSTWSARLLPALCFVIATVLWGRLLLLRSRAFVPVALLGAALLLGSSFWLDQSAQLKQYTLDVLLALLPFTLGDEFFEESLSRGLRKRRLVLIALPCLLSYTYPIVLLARLLGWYVTFVRNKSWRLRTSAVCVLLATIALGLTGIWFTDYRFNIVSAPAYLNYWGDCSLRSELVQGGAPRLLASFLWGWHGRIPLVTPGIAILQILGVRQVISRWRRPSDEPGDSWGSRSLGSIALLLGVMLASLVFNYPICSGRTILFSQIHTQILALEGALFVVNVWNNRYKSLRLLYGLTLILALCSVGAYARSVQAEAAEDITPMVPKINPDVADTLWVHPCSCAQVRALPSQIPVGTVLLGSQTRDPLKLPPEGSKVWVMWTHMGDRFCRGRWARIRCAAKNWEVVYEGVDSGLALADF
jgi:hypothetical protein